MAAAALVTLALGCRMFDPQAGAERDLAQMRRGIEEAPAGEVRQASYDAALETGGEEEEDAGKSSTFSWESLSPSRWGQNVRELSGRGRDPEAAKRLYVEAETAFRRATEGPPAEREERYVEAERAYLEAAARWPDSALEQDALFMAGEAAFFADRYDDANDHYEELLKRHPTSRHLDRLAARRYALARYWILLEREEPEPFYAFNLFDERRPWRDTFGSATRVFDRIRLDDPTGELADDATLAAGNAYFHARNFQRADEFYEDLRQTFPSSEHQFQAHLLGLKAKLLTYRGAAYNDEALEEGEKLVKQIRRQFPRESEAESEYLARAYAEIRFRKAERTWERGKYYERRKEYGAARIMYRKLLEEFEPENPFVPKARERLAEIADRPEAPPQRLTWLAELFPDRAAQAPPIPLREKTAAPAGSSAGASPPSAAAPADPNAPFNPLGP